MVVQAFDDQGNGFRDRYLTINLNAERHPDILAACLSMRGDNDQVETCIAVSNALVALPKQDQKKCLAHEWIHAMMVFRGESAQKNTQNKRLSDQPEEALYGYLLASNSFWQDDEPLSQQFNIALSQLLVPSDLVSRVLREDLQTGIDRLCEDSNTKTNLTKVIDMVNDFTKIFSSRYSVSPENATKGLIRAIFEGRPNANAQFLSLSHEFWTATLASK
jgi:hypothetical protein